MEKICPRHKTVLAILTDCRQCCGEGELEDPDGFDNEYIRCWACNGTGAGSLGCEMCVLEYELEGE